MRLDPPAILVNELLTRIDALEKAEANVAARPGSKLHEKVRNAAVTALNKTIDKCSIELGQPAQPRPTIEPQEDGTLKLLYPTP